MNNARPQEHDSVARRALGRLSASRRAAAPAPPCGPYRWVCTRFGFLLLFRTAYSHSFTQLGFRSGLPGALVDVAVGDRHVELLVVAITLGQVLGDHDRTVASTGAADRDHEMRLTLGDVLRQQEVEQRMQPLIQLLQPAVARDVLDDALVVAGQLAQFGHVVRICAGSARRAPRPPRAGVRA